MVAITVILAAVIATFVLGLGEDDTISDGQTVRVTWTNPNGGNSAVIGSSTVDL